MPTGRPDHVEQRILEQAARLGPGGAVGGWAALRWQGARYFDGRGPAGRDRLAVPLLLNGSNLRGHPGCVIDRRALDPGDVHVVAGLPVAAPTTALVDELLRLEEAWARVTALDMALAAGLVDLSGVRHAVASRVPVRRRRAVETAVDLARGDLRSPREAWLDLVWRLVAGLPRAEANVPLFGLDGSFLGVPDLLDPVAGLVAEYDGAHHRERGQRRADVGREERFRDHGLEYVAVVGGEGRRAVAARLLAVRGRAPFTPPDQRRWTVEQPFWWRHRR